PSRAAKGASGPPRERRLLAALLTRDRGHGRRLENRQRGEPRLASPGPRGWPSAARGRDVGVGRPAEARNKAQPSCGPPGERPEGSRDSELATICPAGRLGSVALARG